MQGWLLENNKTIEVTFESNINYFASQFYDFGQNHENSKTEEFDVSQEYLKSDNEKSIILKEINQSYFLKALEVYNKTCLYKSLYLWKKINQKQKNLERKNPKNMTKVFLKLFYLLNKKIRTKVEKSFVKIHNFTKYYEMKTYETPIVKGINKLDQTFKTLNKKYFYDHPQQIVSQAFGQINFYAKIFERREKTEKIAILINKMIKNTSLTQFCQLMKKWGKTLQKIDIFVGSLNLIVNPVKRDVFQKLRKTVFHKQFFKDSETKFSAGNNKKLKFKRVRGYNIQSNKNKGMIECLEQKRSESQQGFEDRKQDVKKTVNVSEMSCGTIHKSPSTDFKIIKSGKSMTFLEPKTNLIKQSNFPSNNNQYLVTICHQKNKQNFIIPNLRQKDQNYHKGNSQYQSLSFQVSAQKKKILVSFKKPESGLAFKSKRPMKKIKSLSKDLIIKLPIPKNSSQKSQRAKRSQQIISEYYDSKKESSRKISHLNKHNDLTTLSLKSLKPFPIERRLIKSARIKSIKKQT